MTSSTMRRLYGALDCWVVPRLTMDECSNVANLCLHRSALIFKKKKKKKKKETQKMPKET